jgi:hypothetical protein
VRGRGDGVYYFEVTTVAGLVERVFPFFGRFPLRGAKRHDFDRFRIITALIQDRPTPVARWFRRDPLSEGSNESRWQAPAQR